MIEEFASLFEGRRDAYGTEEGGCVRPERFVGNDEWKPVPWDRIVQEHLSSANPIGVYPLVPYQQCQTDMGLAIDWRVKWGCVDFDIKTPTHKTFDYETEPEAHTAARNLQTTLRVLGLTSWIERTRSHGRHVWVFAFDWVPAATMRRALLFACGVAGVPTREVNPKSEGSPDPAFLGNYCRLPYPGGALAQQPVDRFIYDLEDGPISCGAFVDLGLAFRATHIELGQIAAMYKPPPKPTPFHPDYAWGLPVDVPRRLRNYINQVTSRVPEDRSGSMFRVAAICKKDGMTYAQAYAALAAVDDAWGKYKDRHDREQRLHEIIERAYA